MRIDKFLKTSRIIKRRTVAKEACESGRIMVNDRIVKPSYDLKEGDRVDITFGDNTLHIVVKSFPKDSKIKSQEGIYEII